MQRQINSGFAADARRVAGPNGVVYSAVNNGELRRRRWNGTSWDTFASGAQYEVIDSNSLWSRYSTAEYFNRITVDTQGDIYTVEPDGGLHWRRYDPATRAWDHRLVEAGSLGYFPKSLILAAGPGVIYYMPGQTGALYRLEYDAQSQRSRRWEVGSGWNAFSRIFSPGSDILYAVRGDTGDLIWYRYNPDTQSWANGIVDYVPVGVRIGTGWQGQYETFATPDSCQPSSTPWRPTRPQVTPTMHAPVALMRTGSSELHYSYVDSEGRAIYAKATDLTGGTPIRLAAVPGMTGLTGSISIAEGENHGIQIAANGLDAEARSNTQTSASGQWGQADTMGGFFETSLTLFRAVSRGSVFIVATSLDQDGLRWIREPNCADGPHEPWNTRRAGDTGAPQLNSRSPLIVVSRTDANGWRFVGQSSDGTIYTKTDDNSTISRRCDESIIFSTPDPGMCHCADQWRSLGGAGFVRPVSALLMQGNGLQVFATGANGVIYTKRETSSGFPETWTVVSAGFTASGPPSATLAPDNKVKIVVRGTDGLIHYTSQAAPDSTLFDAWQAIAGTDESATDPTALDVPGSNTWVVAYRTDLDVPRLRRYVPAAAATPADTSSAFLDVPITLPSA